MSDLPPDLGRLRVLEQYLLLQLGEVRARIAEVDTQQVQPPVHEAEKWWVEYRRTPDGFRPTVVHAPDCFTARGVRAEKVTREEAAAALAAPDSAMVPCALCTPDTILGVS